MGGSVIIFLRWRGFSIQDGVLSAQNAELRCALLGGSGSRKFIYADGPLEIIVCASRPPPRPIGDLRRGGTHRPHLRRKVLFCLEGQATNVEIEARKLALSMVERLQRESFELPERLLDLPGALLDTLIASSTHLWCSGGVSERSRIARGGSGKLSSTLRGGAGRPETAILELFG